MIHLQEYRKRAGLSQQELADRLGVSRSTVAMWETDKSRPDTAMLTMLCWQLDVSADVLLGLVPPGLATAHVDPPAYVPVVAAVAAGAGGEIEEDQCGYQAAFGIARPQECKYFKVRGDSMSPQILDGDLVLVRMQRQVESGQLAVVLVGSEEGLIKQVRYSADSLVLFSFNPAYPPRVFVGDEAGAVTIWGRVESSVRSYD